MRVTLSAAVTADGYMDDDSPRRLIISTPGDWEEVYRLRAAHDAILAGAETLRRDDPSLLVRDQAARARRVQAGLKPDIAKVTLTRSGGLSPRLRFFTAGDADRYVFSPGEITGLQNIATVISTSEAITAKYIVTELEKRGIERLMVEGGAEVLRPDRRVGPGHPPAFLWATVGDATVPVENTLDYARALRARQVPFELHLFQDGPHAMGLADRESARDEAHYNAHAAAWHPLCIDWLKGRG